MTYAPVPVQPGKNTFEGIGRLRTATILAIAMNIIGMLMALWLLTMVGQLTAGDIGAALGAIALILLFGVVIVIIGIIALVFAIWGLSTVHSGREEFGAGHAESVKKGVNFIIFGIVVNAAASVLGFVLGLGVGLTLNADEMRNSLLMAALVGGGAGLVSTILYALGMQALLAKILTVRGRGLRMPFLATAIGGGVVALAISVIQVYWFDPFALNDAAGIESLAGIVSIISLYVYFMQLKDAETGGRNMIQSGQYDPDATGAAPPVAAAPPM